MQLSLVNTLVGQIALFSNRITTVFNTTPHETFAFTAIPAEFKIFDTTVIGVNISPIVTSIGSDAFYYCSALSSVTGGSGVTTIDSYAFRSCGGLTSFTIPNKVTSIGSYAFYYCNNITSLTIGSAVTEISQRAFGECSSLTSVTIPNSVTSMGTGVFFNCTNLSTINCFVTRTILNQVDVLLNTTTPFTINVPILGAVADTWTAGADTIGGQSVTVVKIL